MHKAILILSSILGIIAICISCTDEKIIKYEEPTVTVTGKVCGWRCAVRDPVNNSGSEHRYSVYTGLPATVKFVREDNCCTFSGQTDDSSVFSVTPEIGAYFAVIETRHCHPDTAYDISLANDTTIDFDIVYEYLTHDTVFIEYFYPDSAESLGYETEWLYVYSFNDWVGDMLNLDGAERIFDTVAYTDWLLVTYHIPTRPEYAPWQVDDKAMRALHNQGLPESFHFYVDHYFCMCMK